MQKKQIEIVEAVFEVEQLDHRHVQHEPFADLDKIEKWDISGYT